MNTADIDQTIANTEKTIKQVEKQLRSMDTLRIEAGLNPGACASFIAQIPINHDNLKAAYERVGKINNGNGVSEMAQPQISAKQKRRSKLAKNMSKKLRI